jgi:hypothetical protein
MTSEYEKALRTVRAMMDFGYPLDVVLQLPMIPEELRSRLREDVERDQNVILVPARTISADVGRPDWLAGLDRSTWYLWPALRQFLMAKKGWPAAAVRSLDDSSDRIL